MKKWIQSYRAQGHEEKVTEGSKSLRLLTDGDSGVSQVSYDWDGGDTVKIEEYAVGLTFDQETVKFPSSAEAKAYIVAKMKGLRGINDRYSLQVDIPESGLNKKKRPRRRQPHRAQKNNIYAVSISRMRRKRNA